MTIDGTYEPSSWRWVAEQVEAYEASGGTEANTLRDTGIPIIVFTTKGRNTGLVRKVALMRVEHDGEYALVASKGGAPHHPGWYHNLISDPSITMQDGPKPWPTTVRLVTGEERAEWWERAAAVFEPYTEYQEKTDREIPVFVTSRR
jgi:deazaflavin-dependent oxidoreductase (nitroreductase family)